MGAPAAMAQQAAGSRLEDIADQLRRQWNAWQDISIEYTCEVWSPVAPGEYRLLHSKQMSWSVTRDGWERIRRVSERSGADADGNAWVEEAAFNGDVYMTYDSQNAGSAAVGRQYEQFLNITYSPKIFGLYVAGLELGLPVDVPAFLRSPEASAAIVGEDEDAVVVEGRDPFAVGDTIKLWLDQTVDFNPVTIESRDSKGLLSTYDDIKYEKYEGRSGEFWFPVKGVWHGINPTDRSPGNDMRYELTVMTVDQGLTPRDFTLAYPKGALLLNTDTGETLYTSQDTLPEDAPLFRGKTITMAQHDRLAAAGENGPLGGSGDVDASKLVFLSVNVAVILVIVAAMRYSNVWRRRSG
jgi:hypothetical protein